MTADIFRALELKDDERVGLFGGTFDPPHEGHVHAALSSLEALQLDRMIVFVTPGNLLKAAPRLSLHARMARLAQLLPDPRFVISDAEAQLGTHATIDLVRALQAAAPKTNFVWIMGGDNLASFTRWQDWHMLATLLPMAIVARGESSEMLNASPFMQQFSAFRVAQAQATALVTSPPPAWVYLAGKHVDVSSSQIRHDADIENKSR